MALCTLDAHVSARQWKTGFRVIEVRRLPGRGRMTNLALLRDPSCRVIRIVRSLKLLQMTRNARRRRDVVVSIRVALCAGNLRVCAGQGEGRFRMIKCGWLPCGRGVAD